MKRSDTTRISIVIPLTMHKALQAAARREKRTYSSIMREALADYLGIPDTVILGGPYARREDKPTEDPQGVGMAKALA